MGYKNREERNEAARRSYWKNRDKCLERNKKWKLEHREEANKLQRDWMIAHPEKKKEYAQKYRKNHPEKYALASKRRHIKHSYGLSIEDYNELIDKQNGRCAICGRKEDEFVGYFNVDHCHKSMKIRGLLCPLCNSAIGLLNDDKELLISALAYLERNS